MTRLLMLAAALSLAGASMTVSPQAAAAAAARTHGPQGPCDIYGAAGDRCVAAYSTTRALYAAYHGPLYQIERQSDRKLLDIGVVKPALAAVRDAGGYANAAAQDAFCANTYCWITTLYDQSPEHNDLTQAPRGGWSGPALGGMDNLPLADMAPVMVMGHEVYGIFIEPGMGLRDDHPRGTAVDDQAEGEYWVIGGRHFNSGCCFDFGNAEIDSRDDHAGTMETTYFGDAPWWYHGKPPGPWVMTDQENNLVGCVNADGSNLCRGLPDIRWRFVTGVAQGEPHRWMSMAGNAQQGALAVMFSGPRVDWRYDPMRKQGGIVLGNGGDNSNGAQGTFYEGVMTAAGTFPGRAVDQRVQANIVAAGYRRLPLSIAPAGAAVPPGLQSFSPRSVQATTVVFTNTTHAPVTDVRLSMTVPAAGWTATVSGSTRRSVSFAGSLAPGASESATFQVRSGSGRLDADLIAIARWRNPAMQQERSARRVEKVRNVPAVRINELRIGTGSPRNDTNSFIELYNAAHHAIDLSHWTVTAHPSQQAISSRVHIPAGTKLPAEGFYLLGLADSGLAAPARAGQSVLYLRSIAGMKAGDTLRVDAGPEVESRRIIAVGTAAANHTTVWQPLPEGPLLSIPPGSTDLPVKDVSGFVVGQKAALGYGAAYPSVGMGLERYELVTITAVGKPGTQAYLAADAPAGATNIKVTADRNISVGDAIRLDIDSLGHGVETVHVKKVGTPASITRLARAVGAGATAIQVREASGFTAGERITLSTPASGQRVKVVAVMATAAGARIEVAPALRHAYPMGAQVMNPGTGVDLTAPLRFEHAANLPFSDRGSGIRFTPATAFAHISNDPVRALGSGIRVERALAHDHPIQAPVRDPHVSTAGYQGTREPNQWFGGPVLVTRSPLFGHLINVRQGSLVLRDAHGIVVDSLNYGGLVDPWAAQGYQAASGLNQDGCYVAAPGTAPGEGVSAGRLPDGRDTDSNCTDFRTIPVTTMPDGSTAGATNIKVEEVTGFQRGEKIRVGAGPQGETGVIAEVGTAGVTRLRAGVRAGATVIPVVHAREFYSGEAISIGAPGRSENAVVFGITPFFEPKVTLSAPLGRAFPAGAQVAGTGITLERALRRRHPGGTQVSGGNATPAAPNRD